MSYAKVPSCSMRRARTTMGLSGGPDNIECNAENVWKYQSNRLPVFPGKVNRWLVQMWGPENMTNEQIRTHIEFLWKDIWFSGDSDRPEVGGIKVQPAKIVKIIPTTEKELFRDFKYLGEIYEAYERQYGKAIANQPYPIPWSFPGTDSGRPRSHIALVEFVYLGPSSSTEYFYPTFNGQREWDCPTGVNTYVAKVFAPSEPSGGSIISSGGSSNGGDSGGSVGEDRDGSTKWIVVAAAGGIGLYLWQRSKKKNAAT